MTEFLGYRRSWYGFAGLATGPLAAWAGQRLHGLYVKYSCLGENLAWCEPSAWRNLAERGPAGAVALVGFGLFAWAAHEMFAESGSGDSEAAANRAFLGGGMLLSMVVTSLALQAYASFTLAFGG